jgi:probable LLM family oxidoreductase
MEIGIDSFVATPLDPSLRDAQTDVRRIAGLLAEIELADRVGLDAFAIGEHHRPDYLASSPATLLAAAAARTERIKLGSAVTVLSSDDPVRVFQQFATVDLISNGRAEIIVGRGSFIESYPLFGYDLNDYDLLFSEKLDLLLKLREQVNVHWKGHGRAALTGQGVYPRPVQNPLPVRLGVGGTPNSFVRAGTLGLPLVVAIIGGEPYRFRPMVDLYREAGRAAGFAPEQLSVSVHTNGYLADTNDQAADEFWPHYSDVFTRIGQERGWGPVTRRQFDAGRSPAGALMVGDPDSVVAKIRSIDEALGGVERISILIDSGIIPHEKTMHAIELLGTKVKPQL